MCDGLVDHGRECNRLSCYCQPPASFKPEQIIPSSHHAGQSGSALLQEVLDLTTGLSRFP